MRRALLVLVLALLLLLRQWRLQAAPRRAQSEALRAVVGAGWGGLEQSPMAEGYPNIKNTVH